MVFFFIAELALTMACRLGVWCLGKTCKGMVYVVTQSHALDDDDDDDALGTCPVNSRLLG
jgi:hypothetical protein